MTENNLTSSDHVREIISSIRSYGKEFCFSCKGDRLLCNFKRCPLLKRAALPVRTERKVDTSIFGPTYSLFVDSFGYPEVQLGPQTILDTEDARVATSPCQWYGLSFDELIKLRSNLIQSTTAHDVTVNNRFMENLQELALTAKPVDTELRFRHKVGSTMTFSAIYEPLGPTGELEFLKITENPKIPEPVEREISEKNSQNDSIWNLYQKGFDVYYLQRALSSGIFNQGTEHRLIPSSWSIKMVDRHLSNMLIGEIKNMPHFDSNAVFSNSYLSNHYEILVVPGEWKFEIFESWAPDTFWNLAVTRPAIYQDFEGLTVSSDDIGKTNGSYHAIRLAALEELKRVGRQATVIVFREIGNDYNLPLGVWHVREAVRHAFKNEPKSFETVEDAVNDLSGRLKTQLSEFTRNGVILRSNWISGLENT